MTATLDQNPELVRIHDLLAHAESMARRACVHFEDFVGDGQVELSPDARERALTYIEEVETVLDSIGETRAALYRFEDGVGP